MKVNFNQIKQDSLNLAKKINKKYRAVYGIPSGGIYPSSIIAEFLKIPLLTFEEFKENQNNVLVVDDLIDSGQTLKNFLENDWAVLYKKKHAPMPTYFLKEVENTWLYLPHETKECAEKNITRLLQYIGEDVNREGLLETPKRVLKSYKHLFSGYNQKVEDILTVFDSESYDQVVLLKDIEFYSTCEHHMQPFFGKAHVAYIPNKKIVGISKLARVVEIYSRRLQNQERLTNQIANAIQKYLNPKGVAVIMEGQHFCMMARGVQKQNSKMLTSCMLGKFREIEAARTELLNLIK